MIDLMGAFDQFLGTSCYIASDEPLQPVNVALALERAFLVCGEPGPGRSLLVEALQLDLIRWHAKATSSRATAGLHVHDAAARPHDSWFGEATCATSSSIWPSRRVTSTSRFTVSIPITPVRANRSKHT